MEKLSWKEKHNIAEDIRNNPRLRRLYSLLNRQRGDLDADETYAFTRQAIDVYTAEVCRKFMKIAEKEASKSRCARRQVGVVLARDGDVLSKAYNGVPYGLVECSNEVPCFKINHHILSGSYVDDICCRALHAEQFAIAKAAKSLKSVSRATAFCTHQPCLTCSLQLIAADIEEIYFKNAYPDRLALGILKKAGVKVYKVADDYEANLVQ